MTRLAYHFLLAHAARRATRNEMAIAKLTWWTLYAFALYFLFALDAAACFVFFIPAARRRLCRWLTIQDPIDAARPAEPPWSTQIPSLIWPLISIALALYLSVAWLAEAAVGDEPVGGALLIFALSAIGLRAAVRFYARRVTARRAWRQARLIHWLNTTELPAPEAVDWDAYERDVEARLRHRS